MATSKITADTWIDVSSHAKVVSAWSNVTKRFMRKGNVVMFAVGGFRQTYVEGFMYNMVELDSAIKPKYAADFLGHRGDPNYNIEGYHEVHINPSGLIQVQAKGTVGSWWYISGWYCV